MKEEGKISNESSFICNVIKKNNTMNQLLFQIYSKKSWKKGHAGEHDGTGHCPDAGADPFHGGKLRGEGRRF